MSAAPAVKTSLLFRIEIVDGPHRGQSFGFDKPVITIGRGSENDLILDNDPRVSRQHVEIKLEDGQFHLKNLSDKNHVLIEGTVVQSRVIEPGEKVLVGETLFVVHAEKPAGTQVRTMVTAATKVTMVKPMAMPTPVSNQSMPVTRANQAMPPPVPYPQGPVAPPPMGGPPPNAAPPPRRPPSSQGSNRLRFYMIVGVIAFAIYLFLSSGSKKKKEEPVIGAPPSIQQEILKADETKKQLQEQKAKMETLQARRAQENFTKGFRDFRQGQYGRAKDAFQVVLTLEPGHEEARRYLTLAKLKFDEQVKKSLQEGRVYFENKNYRLCKSSFLNVMTMLSQSPNDPTYQEAKKLYDICDLAQGGS